MMWNALGLLGVIIISISLLPQVVKSYRTKSVGDLSPTYIVTLALGLWFVLFYAISIGDFIFITGNVISFSLTLIQLALIAKYRRLRGTKLGRRKNS